MKYWLCIHIIIIINYRINAAIVNATWSICTRIPHGNGLSPEDGASPAQTTQETIPFTTVTFSYHGSHLMCSLALLCWASSLRRWWMGEICPCLLQHTSKEAPLCKGKSWEGLLIAYPSCTTAFWTEAACKIYKYISVDVESFPGPDKPSDSFDHVTMVKMAFSFSEVTWNGAISC